MNKSASNTAVIPEQRVGCPPWCDDPHEFHTPDLDGEHHRDVDVVPATAGYPIVRDMHAEYPLFRVAISKDIEHAPDIVLWAARRDAEVEGFLTIEQARQLRDALTEAIDLVVA